MRLKLAFLLAVIVGLATACEKSKTTEASSSSTNVVAEALSELKSAVPNVSDGVTFAGLNHGDGLVSPYSVGLSSHLSKANFFYPGDNGGTEVTPAAFLEAMFSDSNSGADDAVFKRANMAFLISCAIDTLATRGGTLYSTSQTSFVMNAARVEAACGDFPELDQMDGATISVTIEDTTDTTNYDQRISMLASAGTNGTTFGSTTNQYMYIRNNASVLSFAHVETNSADSGASVSYLHFDKATDSGRFQYASIWGTSGKHFYRINVDSSANTTSVLTYTAATGKWAKILARSTAESQTQAAISMSWSGMSTNAGGSAAVSDATACMNVSGTMAVATDNTLVCSTAVTLPGPASDTDTLLGTTFGTVGAGKSNSDIATLTTLATGSAYAPSFTGTTISTSALGF